MRTKMGMNYELCHMGGIIGVVELDGKWNSERLWLEFFEIVVEDRVILDRG